MILMPSESFAESCFKLAEMYREDLPSPECFTSEIETWRMKWQEHSKNHGNTSLPDSPKNTLPQTTSMYPNIKVLLTILATLPVTTCSAERSFSILKRIKTSIRSSMTTTRLSNLTLLHVFRDIEVDLPSAINEFTRSYPRRLQMSDMTNVEESTAFYLVNNKNYTPMQHMQCMQYTPISRAQKWVWPKFQCASRQ